MTDITCLQEPPVPPVLTEYVAPALAAVYDEPAPMIEYMTRGPAVTYTAPEPVLEYDTPAAPAPVIKSVSFARDDTYIAPVSPRANRDIRGLVNPQCSIFAVEASAPQVVGSFPTVDESAPLAFTSKFIRNRSLRSQGDLSVRNSTPLKTLYTCPSVRSRSSLWKVSRRSLRIVFLSGSRSRTRTLLFLIVSVTQRPLQWSKTFRPNQLFPVQQQFRRSCDRVQHHQCPTHCPVSRYFAFISTCPRKKHSLFHWYIST